jgi:hypothetical protein
MIRNIEYSFSKSLIMEALSNEKWEFHEVGMLFHLLFLKLNISNNVKKQVYFLQDCGIHDPKVLSVLCDLGLQITNNELVNLIYNNCSTFSTFCYNIQDAFEQGLLHLKDDDTINMVSLLRCE